MPNSKFSIGDTLVPIPDYSGFEEMTIYNIDSEKYYAKIFRGTISISRKVVEELYQKKEV